jgi:hypothetical protein
MGAPFDRRRLADLAGRTPFEDRPVLGTGAAGRVGADATPGENRPILADNSRRRR